MNPEAFLPRSDSKIVIALTLGAYSIVLERLIFLLVRVFASTRQPKGMFAAYGRWVEALDSVILFPIVAGGVLVATIELLLPPLVQVLLAAAMSCAINAISWWPLGIIVAPSFLLSGYGYLRWRPDSWWVAFTSAILVIFVSCLPSGISVFQHAIRNI